MSTYPVEFKQLEEENERLQAENKRLRGNLIKYGSHGEGCESFKQDRNTMGMGLTRRKCNCGFEQALQEKPK